MTKMPPWTISRNGPSIAIINSMTALRMPQNHSASETEHEAKRRAIAEARDSVKAEGSISHAAMGKWLDSWGKADELPPSEPCQ